MYKAKIALRAIQRDPMIGVWVMEYPRLLIDIFISIYIDTHAYWIPSISSSHLIEKSYTKCLLNQSVNKSLRWIPLTSEYSSRCYSQLLLSLSRKSVRDPQFPAEHDIFALFSFYQLYAKKNSKKLYSTILDHCHDDTRISRTIDDDKWAPSTSIFWWNEILNLIRNTRNNEPPEWWRIAFEMGKFSRIFIMCRVCRQMDDVTTNFSAYE